MDSAHWTQAIVWAFFFLIIPALIILVDDGSFERKKDNKPSE